MIGLVTRIDGDTLGVTSVNSHGGQGRTLTRPDDIEEISSILGLEPNICLLSPVIGRVVAVWHISDGGIRHED